MLYQVMPD